MDLIERACDLIDAGVRSRSHVCAGVKDHSADAEPLGAIELVDHGCDRLAMKLRICRR